VTDSGDRPLVEALVLADERCHLGLSAAATAPERKVAALCLSGGGIRSATFGLGILQGLARARVIDRFDYLSTVSGGGYLGAWLSSWILRNPGGAEGVWKELAKDPSRDGGGVEEPLPVQHLRRYSNYLSPRLGFASLDTWTLVGTVLRNLLLNWVVLVPVLAAVLCLPLAFHLMQRDPPGESLLLGGLATVVLLRGIGRLGILRPSIQWEPPPRGEVFGAIATTVLGCTGLVLAVAWVYAPPSWQPPFSLRQAVVFGTVVDVLAWVVSILVYYVSTARKLDLATFGRQLLSEAPLVLFALPVVAVCGALGGLFAGLLLRPLLGHPHAYTVLGLPVLLGAFLLGVSLFLGLASLWTSDLDREWWARVGGLLLLLSTGWAVLAVITVYAPIYGAKLPGLAKAGVAALGGVTGIVTLVLGYGARTIGKKGDPADGSSSNSELLLKVAAPLFALALLGVIAIGSHAAFVRLSPPVARWVLRLWPAGAWMFPPSSALLILLAMGGLIALSAIASYFVNVNKFSLHGMYRNRLIRAYLGASRERHPEPFSGFDPDDNVQMWELRPEMVRSREIRDPEGLFNLWLLACRPWEGTDAEPWPQELARRLLQEGNPFTTLRTRLTANEKMPPRDRWTASERRRIIAAGIRDQINVNLRRLAESRRVLTLKGEKASPSEAISLSQNREFLFTHFAPHLLPQGRWGTTTVLAGDILNVQEATRRILADPRLKVFLVDGEASSEASVAAALNRALETPGLGRAAVDQTLGDAIRSAGNGPLHVVNCAINLVGGPSLAWQQRKAASFTISPLHAGMVLDMPGVDDREPSAFRSTLVYGGKARGGDGIRGKGVSLGTAITISGAAVSPNMGYHSSGLITFLLTLFNCRLGCWLGNPGRHGNKTYRLGQPTLGVWPLYTELLGRTDHRGRYVYLSDGGHFENLGMYEMLRRRCAFIVASDAGCDPKFVFDDLANLVRKVRVDLGIEIDFDTTQLRASGAKEPLVHCAVGRIKYPDQEEGCIVYFKPAVCDGKPADVRNYREVSGQFPHETTVDQFFTETQFESYRALGEHAVECVLGKSWKGGDLEELRHSVLQFVAQRSGSTPLRPSVA